ncbi:hypothetical protein ACWYRQ_03595 [Clostridioides difficile]
MKSTMKKGILGLLLVIMCVTGTDMVYAAEVNLAIETASSKSVDTKAEQLKWYYRIHNGKKQKRLWSITYGYWKTNWINV